MPPAQIADQQLVKDLMRSQIRDLTSVLNPGNFVAVPNLWSARTYARMHKYRIRRVSDDYRFSRAFVIDKGDDGAPECWVAVDERGYRRIFHAFLRGYAQFPRATRLARDVHVDHILSRHICRAEGMTFGRVALIPNKANVHHGPRERAYVENAMAVMPAADVDEESAFDPGPARTDASLRSRIEMCPLWGPQLVKLLPEFVAPATGRTTTLHVLEILRQMRDQSFLQEGDLDQKYGAILSGYRLFASGIPHYDAQARSYAYASDNDGNILTPYHTLGEWLLAEGLREIEKPAAWSS